MSTYFEALNRRPPIDDVVADLPKTGAPDRQGLHVLPMPFRGGSASEFLPAGAVVAAALARTGEIQRLAETFAASANLAAGSRLAVTGCTRGDGASTLAAALALDLSQRLAMRTALVECNARRSNFARFFPATETSPGPSATVHPLRSWSTRWNRLALASLRLVADKPAQAETCAELNQRLSGFPAAILDLGTVRTDSRALSLVGENDPVLVVARAGYTRRQELLATTTILGNSAKRIAGVVLNGVEPATPLWLRRFFEKGI